MSNENQNSIGHAEECVIQVRDSLPEGDPRREQLDALLVQMSAAYHAFAPKKKFKVTACYYTYCTAEVEAENEDQAYEIARDMDGGDFTPSDTLGDWHINNVVEVGQ